MMGALFLGSFWLISMKSFSLRQFYFLSLTLLGALAPNFVHSHGGVAFEEDLCVISINFMQAHFTVFQPETRQTKEFCEDIPDKTNSVFIMEYLHELLSEMKVDFRIVRDVNNAGKYADWEDVKAIADLDAATVYYQPPSIEPGGYYRASHRFDEGGTYIGVVTADHPTEDRNYNAVFYFQVGGRDWGNIPVFIVLLLAVQGGYWFNTGGYRKYKKRKNLQGLKYRPRANNQSLH